MICYRNVCLRRKLIFKMEAADDKKRLCSLYSILKQGVCCRKQIPRNRHILEYALDMHIGYLDPICGPNTRVVYSFKQGRLFKALRGTMNYKSKNQIYYVYYRL